MKKWIKYSLGAIAVLALVSALGKKDKDGNNSASSAALNSDSARQGTNSASPTVSLPSREAEFIKLVEESRRNYSSAQNDLAAGGVRVSRKVAICKILSNDYSVSDWVGTISDLSSNNDGRGVLSIRIAKDVNLKTWNNAVSDIGSNTLIDPSSPLFSKLSEMSKGTKVKFSGTFIAGGEDCVQEGSMSQAGSMKDPEFIFSYRSVDRL